MLFNSIISNSYFHLPTAMTPIETLTVPGSLGRYALVVPRLVFVIELAPPKTHAEPELLRLRLTCGVSTKACAGLPNEIVEE